MLSTIPDLLHELRSGQHSSSPRLTWYGPGGERIELSGRVLDNWVAKTSNFLSEELDAERGTRIRLALPAHWKSAVVALAAWQVGAVLLEGEADAATDADITFWGPGTDDGGTTGGEQVAVALGALELAYPGQLPAGTYDYAALVRQFADSYEPFDPPEPSDAALGSGPRTLTQAALLEEFAVAAGAGERILVSAREGLLGVLARLLGAWGAGGSAVLLHEEAEDSPRLRAAEKVTAGDGAARNGSAGTGTAPEERD
ncbi:TIGR03089 family protein [Sinomonas cellulolyticus]|uniref:TIGR03089 family protein n=1 Tax=Sinomonas cellulolyticus TaxID=2801916 RepID=A0ABS1JZ79_9MICC|nr:MULTISPECIES: TIGR03089 family protein [Sinomonas]MBL0704432.1 TIGR03089 family protein [Sinomonas cellulolyticus]GHG48643.1 TIGR03089 family protein [Sinomonas sp. KCTC 49339]